MHASQNEVLVESSRRPPSGIGMAGRTLRSKPSSMRVFMTQGAVLGEQAIEDKLAFGVVRRLLVGRRCRRMAFNAFDLDVLVFDIKARQFMVIESQALGEVVLIMTACADLAGQGWVELLDVLLGMARIAVAAAFKGKQELVGRLWRRGCEQLVGFDVALAAVIFELGMGSDNLEFGLAMIKRRSLAEGLLAVAAEARLFRKLIVKLTDVHIFMARKAESSGAAVHSRSVKAKLGRRSWWRRL